MFTILLLFVAALPAAAANWTVNVSGPLSANPKYTVKIRISTEADEVTAKVVMKGLRFVEASKSGCTASELKLSEENAPQGSVTYTCAVTGEVGTKAYFGLEDIEMLNNGRPGDARSTSWTCTIKNNENDVMSENPDLAIEMQGEDQALLIYDMIEVGRSMTIAEFENSLDFHPSWKLEVFKSADIEDGILEAKGPYDLLATDDYIRFLGAQDKRMFSGLVVCRGDVTGSGTLSLTQLIRLASALREPELEDESVTFVMAGDLNDNDKIDLGDLVLMARDLRTWGT